MTPASWQMTSIAVALNHGCSIPSVHLTQHPAFCPVVCFIQRVALRVENSYSEDGEIGDSVVSVPCLENVCASQACQYTELGAVPTRRS